MKHTASARFWQCFDTLPPNMQALARKNYELLRADPSHPSLRFKQVAGKFFSVRVGLYHRALGIPVEGGVHWFWIGSPADYDNLLS